jgi:hypothetical protein
MTTNPLSKFLVLSTLALTPAAALADAHSLVTVSVGTAFAFGQASDPRSEARSSATPDLELRLRLFHVMAFDFSYSPLDRPQANAQLTFSSQFRASAVLYLVPLEVLGVYAKAGIGGQSLGDLATVTSPTNSYHGGGGVEVYLTDHVALGAEFLVLVPGVTSIQKAVANDLVRRQALVAAGGSDTDQGLGVGDFLSAQNFRTSVNLRYFF